jgi:two-component system chemotaxis response regulator CheY
MLQHKHKILVVDDETEVRETIRMQLGDTQFEVIEAVNGEDGIAMLNAEDNPLIVDVIICDVRMPKINGIEAVAYFRREYPSTPVIVLTGFPDSKLAVEFLKEGVVDYLVKPVAKEQLIEAVTHAAEKHRLFGDGGDSML